MIAGNGLNDDDMSNLCVAFAHMDGLRSLVLDGWYIIDTRIKQLLFVILANKIQMQGAKELAAVLKNIVQLEKLSLKCTLLKSSCSMK